MIIDSERNSSGPAYALQGVTFRYATRFHDTSVSVLKDLTCSIDTGKILGILGPNGSGKSTLLKLLARVLSPRDGKIELFGTPLSLLSQAEVARQVALVPQETLQIFPFTIAEMVLMGRFPHHRGWGGWHWEDADDWQIARLAMEDLDVANLGSRRVTDVSGGERQRAVIARALTQQPQVLLLDEPTAFLDLHHQLDIARILRRLNRERGLTVILVSHDLNLASQYCDRLMLLHHGKIVEVGSPRDVLRPDLLESVYGCQVLVDRHPQSGLPRVSLPV
jgi:iron complex transport system ATP-binding protein